MAFNIHCYLFPKFLLVSWWRFKTFWKTIDDVNIFWHRQWIIEDVKRYWHRQWIPDLIWRVFLLCFDFSFPDSIWRVFMCQTHKLTNSNLCDFTIFCWLKRSDHRLVEIPWKDNNVINAVITRDYWIEHQSWTSIIDWNPSRLRHSEISIFYWRSLVVFNFHELLS